MVYKTVTFKTVGDVKLDTRVFTPEANATEGHSMFAPPAGRRPAFVFFACGGWNGFEVEGLTSQCTYLAARGAVCFATLVRVTPVHGTTPAECVIDAKSAERWVRAHAKTYGIDPQKIVTSGGSAAGHVSACTALIDDFNDPADDLAVSCKPNIVNGFCPALVIHHTQSRVERFGGPERAKALSPILHITPAAPPCLIQYGGADDVTYPEEGRLFKTELDRHGVKNELHIFPGEGHGFHNYFDGKNPMFYITHRNLDKFVTSFGFLNGPPTIDTFPFEAALARKE